MFSNSLLKGKNIIFSESLKENIINLSNMTFDIPQGFSYKVITVDRDYIARPDLLSYKLYGDDQYGDLICKLNGISNPFELNEGDMLVIPDFEYLESFMYTDGYDDTNKQMSSSPKAKSRKDKRTPNEAIIGDTRFKIDKTNRIIIY